MNLRSAVSIARRLQDPLAELVKINFDDSFIYQQLSLPERERAIPQERMLGEEAIETFKAWDAKTDKTEY